MRVTTSKVVEVALSMPWSTNPTSNLGMAVRQETDCSDRVAASAVRRTLKAGLLRQEWSSRKVYNPLCSGSKGDPYWKQEGAVWKRPEEGET